MTIKTDFLLSAVAARKTALLGAKDKLTVQLALYNDQRTAIQAQLDTASANIAIVSQQLTAVNIDLTDVDDTTAAVAAIGVKP